MTETEIRGRQREGQQRGGHEMLILLATRAWSLLTGIVTQSLLARVLAPEGRGLFAICAMFGTLFGTFFAFGTDRGAQYQMMAGRQSVSASTVIGLSMIAIATVLAVLVGLPLSESSLPFFRNADPELLRLSMLLIPITLATTFLSLQLAGMRRFERLGIVTVIRVGVYLVALLTFVWYLDLGVRGAIFAMLVSSGLEAVLYLRTLSHNDGLRLVVPKRHEIREVLSYGVAYYPARIGTHIDLQASALFLATLGTREEIGFFAAASALTLRLFLISDSFETAVLPRIASAESERHDLVGFCLRLSGGLTALAALGLCVFAIPLVGLLYSDSFLPAVELIWIMSPGIALYSAGKTLMAYFRATDRAAVCSQAIWLGLVVNAGILVWLYPRVGMPAAAWSMSAGFLVRSAFLAWIYRRTSGVGFATTWLPKAGDVARILDEVRLATPGASDVTIRAGQVTKQQEPHAARRELENTEAGQRLARQSGKFEVPRILDSDLSAGRLVFEEVAGARPLAQVVSTLSPEEASAVATQVAGALAAIHQERIHGDFSLSNLLYRPHDRRLFVVDWSEAKWIEAAPGESPREVDLAVFLLSLFYRRPLSTTGLRKPDDFAREVFTAYAEARGQHFDLGQFRRLFDETLAQFAANRAAVRGAARSALYRPSLWRVARFVKTLKLDTVAGRS